MRLRDLFGKTPAHSDYSGRETASQRAARKEAAASAARRQGHRRSIPGATRAERRWDEEDRRRFRG